MKLSDTAPQCEGILHLSVYQSGKLRENIAEHNMIMDAGRGRMAELLSGEQTGKHIGYLGVGTGAVAPMVTDKDLTNRQLIPITSVDFPTARTARFHFVIATTDANGMAIHEFGLFCVDNLMFSRRVRDKIIDKAADIEITGYWDIRF